MSLGYMMIGTNQIGAALKYYEAVVTAMGGTVKAASEAQGGWYQLANGDSLIVAAPFDGQPASVGNGMMMGLICKDEAEVQAAHAAAMANGGRNEGDPGPRPQYGPHFYAGYARDPDGNKMSFAFYRS